MGTKEGLLVFDIGNTNIVVGCFYGEELAFQLRLQSDSGRTSDEYAVIISSLLAQRVGENFSCNAAVIGSVVPALTEVIVALVRDLFAVEPLVAGPGVRTGLSVVTKVPAAVGVDRVVNALAAKVLFGLPALIVDFGTAISFDFVDEQSSYRGGAIAPGMLLGVDALARRTAKLPKVEISWPGEIVGRDTVEAMQVGTVVGCLCMVEGLIERFQQEVGPIEHIITTGGAGSIIVEHSDKLKIYEPHLTLKGLQILYKLNTA